DRSLNFFQSRISRVSQVLGGVQKLCHLECITSALILLTMKKLFHPLLELIATAPAGLHSHWEQAILGQSRNGQSQ
ncbi:hypothetical protein OAK47_03775, partial [Planctomycetaceae bacterium]|nr:hypothetical protein [Planctomycetaceae bacterium]